MSLDQQPTGSGNSMPQQWTSKDILAWSTAFLKKKGSPSARLDAEILLAGALQCERIKIYTNFDRPLTVDERQSFKQKLQRRSDGEPIAYIVGERAFWKYNFKVSSDVLIPRPDTETLIEAVLLAAKENEKSFESILDIGTGSGCIAISLAKEFETSVVEAWDLSHEALALAEQNAKLLEAQRIEFKHVDALQASEWPATAQYDLVVSNPPYIAKQEAESLARSVLNFEPHEALFAEEDGLRFYRMIAEHAGGVLKEGGCLALEIGLGQADKVENLLAANHFTNIEQYADLAGIARVIMAEKPKLA